MFQVLSTDWTAFFMSWSWQIIESLGLYIFKLIKIDIEWVSEVLLEANHDHVRVRHLAQGLEPPWKAYLYPIFNLLHLNTYFDTPENKGGKILAWILKHTWSSRAAMPTDKSERNTSAPAAHVISLTNHYWFLGHHSWSNSFPTWPLGSFSLYRAWLRYHQDISGNECELL